MTATTDSVAALIARLGEIEKRANAATPGEWISGELGTSEADTTIFYVRSESSSPEDVMTGNPDVSLCCDEANALFIEAAHADIPFLTTALRDSLARLTVDDAMVERACVAVRKTVLEMEGVSDSDMVEPIDEKERAIARAALRAALEQAP